MKKPNNNINGRLPVWQWTLTALLALLSSSVLADRTPPPPDEAMQLSVTVEDQQTVRVSFALLDEVYLYQHALAFTGEDLDVDQTQLKLPQGKEKDDPAFGLVQTYWESLQIDVPVMAIGEQPKLQIKYQGCVDGFICYPPQRKTIDLTGQLLPAAVPAAADQGLLNLGNNSSSGFFANDQQLLPVDQAFQFETIALDAEVLMVRFTMAPNIYLYKDQVAFTTFTDGVQLGEPVFPEAQLKDDPEFGLVDVFYDVVEIELPYSRSAAGIDTLDIEAAFQGCEDGKVCYPPTAQLATVDLPPAATLVTEAASTQMASQVASQGQAPDLAVAKSETEEINEVFDESIFWIMLQFFGFGLLLALTPCVFPMIPILSGLIVGQKDPSTAKAFTLSVIYVLAMAVTYTAVGVVMGLMEINAQALFQKPWIITVFTLIFVLLSLSMFGFYDLQLPASWQNKLTHISNRQKGGTYVGVAVMGLLSALIVGPCVAPPLAAAVIYISTTDGGPVLGGLALFAMSLGMGAPLIAIGTSAGKWMPNAGGWMNVVKSFFGILLLGMAIWFLSRILPGDITLMLWGVLLIASAVMWHQHAKNNGLSGWVMSLFDALRILLLIVGTAQLIGGMAGKSDPIRPLKGVFSGGAVTAQKVEFKMIKSLADLQREIEQSDQPVFLDFYADWCVECKRMERTTFQDPEIVALTAQMTVLKADVTANDAVDAALMKRFGIVGPPASLFFAADGTPLKALNFFGYKNASDLKQTFEKILK
ncbi:protein-disulfide reductase DsbD [Marinicella meishanensis]|uniref:protein-disulfide reductase DsbD n=1 Tax=Marinicella meishanensis TaxID=2873263 RepID=UPI001CBE2B59|nr:protein-disulfide reductase DsbD [Marinicella sp. NBU2979]